MNMQLLVYPSARFACHGDSTPRSQRLHQRATNVHTNYLPTCGDVGLCKIGICPITNSTPLARLPMCRSNPALSFEAPAHSTTASTFKRVAPTLQLIELSKPLLYIRIYIMLLTQIFFLFLTSDLVQAAALAKREQDPQSIIALHNPSWEVNRVEWYGDSNITEPHVEYVWREPIRFTEVITHPDGTETAYAYEILSHSCGLIKLAAGVAPANSINQFCEELRSLESNYWGSITEWTYTTCTGGIDGPCKRFIFFGAQAADHYFIGPATRYLCVQLFNKLNQICDDFGGVLTVNTYQDFTMTGQGSANAAYHTPNYGTCPNPARPAPGEPAYCDMV